MAVLLLLAVVLFFVTIIGHGMWVAAASFFRAIDPQPTRRKPYAYCPSCKGSRPVRDGRCHVCGWGPLEPSDVELELTLAGLRDLRERGLLSQDRLREIGILIRAEIEERRANRATTAPTSPATVHSTPAPTPVPAPPPPPATPPSPPPEPRTSRGTLADLLQAFMEQRNIRWIEIVSGILIVGSSIGLVISLWATLRDAIPYFPALVFLLGTAAIHGAGTYTLRAWDLKSTSRGLLVIAQLLVPLDYLAAIALSEQRPVADPLYLASVVLGTIAFGLIVWSGARMLVGRAAPLLFVAVMLPSVAQLVIARTVTPDSGTATLLLLLAPAVLGHLTATVGQAIATSRWDEATPERAGRVSLLLGSSTFALLVVLGLTLWKHGSVREVLAALSPLLSVALAGCVALGVVLRRRAARPEVAEWGVAATALALLASALMVVVLALTWPRPGMLLVVALVDFAALAAITLATRSAYLHVPAHLCLGFAAVIAVNVLTGRVELGTATGSLLEVLLAGRGAFVLVLLATADAIAALFLRRSPLDAAALRWAALGLAGLGAAGASYSGFGPGDDGSLAAVVLVLGGLVVITAGSALQQVPCAWLGSGLVLAGFVQATTANAFVDAWLPRLGWSIERPVLLAFVVHAALVALGSIVWETVVRRRGRDPEERLEEHPARVLASTALATSFAAAPFVLLPVRSLFERHAVYATIVALVWASVAWRRGSPRLFSAAQAMATVAVPFLVTAVCRRVPIWGESPLHAAQFAAHVGALAVWSIAWVGFRRLPVPTSVRRLWQVSCVPVDRVVLVGTVVGIAGLSLLLAWPGVAAELATARLDAGTRAVPGIAVLLLALVGGVVAACALGARRPLPSLLASTLVGVGILVGVPDRLAAGWWSLAGTESGPYAVPAAWGALVLVLVAVAVTRFAESVVGLGSVLLGLLALVPVLASAGVEASATALRWGWSLYGLLAAGVLLVSESRTGRRGVGERRDDLYGMGDVAVLLSVVPVLGLTLRILLGTAAGREVAVLPMPFVSLTAAWSATLPVVGLGAALLFHTRRGRSEWLAAAASLTAGVALCTFLVVDLRERGADLGPVTLVGLLQRNALLFAAMAFARSVIRSLRSPRRPSTAAESTESVEFAVSALLLALLVVRGLVLLVLHPGATSPELAALGAWPGLAALVLLTANLASWGAGHRARALAHALAWLGLCSVVFAAAGMAEGGDSPNWLAYHVLLAGWGSMAALFTGAAVSHLPQRINLPTAVLVRWAAVFVAGVVLLSMRGLTTDPHRPWWSVGGLAGAAVCVSMLAVLGRSTPGAGLATWLAVVASICAGLRPWLVPGGEPTDQSGVDVGELALATFAGMSVAWLAVEIVWQRRFGASRFDPTTSATPAVHHVAPCILLPAWFAIVVAAFVERASPGGADADLTGPWYWVGLTFTGLLVVGRLWDRSAVHGIGGLCALGLLGSATLLHELAIEPKRLSLAFAITGAIWVCSMGVTWRLRHRLARWRTRLSIPADRPLDVEAGIWLGPLSAVLAVAVVGCAFHAVLTLDEPRLRWPAPLAIGLLVPGIVALAEGERRRPCLLAALLLGALATANAAWALPGVPSEPALLQYGIRLLVATAATAFAYGAVLAPWSRRSRDWSEAAERSAAVVGGAALATLLFVLAQEARHFDPVRGAPLSRLQVACVFTVLVGLSGAFVAMGLRPDRDVLRLPEERRSAWVYAAEAVLALAFLHLYLAMPGLFRGLVLPWWPLAAMGIAFLGAGVGELLRRTRVDVLATPLHRTAVFLPLLPALGFWLHASRTDYSTVLFLAGLLYVLVASWRRHWAYVAAAAVAGNAGLWAFWSEHGTALAEHPQVWLIPPALSALVAGQLNRDRLTDAQLQSLRYTSILVVYASSTGEMFLTGVGHSLLLPMVLAGLSVLGVFAGIVLRIRAFLYLGATFLLLSITSMVWHAARNIGHVWPWWAFGIALGLLILAAFGVLEKKRPQAMRLIHELRTWEP